MGNGANEDLVPAIEGLIVTFMELLRQRKISFTVADFVRMIEASLKLNPQPSVIGSVTWIDGWH